jgi:hypothetical protein
MDNVTLWHRRTDGTIVEHVVTADTVAKINAGKPAAWYSAPEDILVDERGTVTIRHRAAGTTAPGGSDGTAD